MKAGKQGKKLFVNGYLLLGEECAGGRAREGGKDRGRRTKRKDDWMTPFRRDGFAG